MPAGPPRFPFAAVVGMDDAKRALECALCSPRIKAVLIRGGEGCAKTTLARSISGITGRKVVECPLNVTDEQLFGGMDVEEAIRTGRSVLEPGLLSRAHGNVLYIDDVNLLDRSMLAGILEAVATGRVVVERGPISATYPCDTTLVATMNPDDSDLSAHVLDRFDLCAYADEEDEAARREVLRRNAEFSDDPDAFLALYDKEQRDEAERVSRASRILPLVTISDELVSVISELCVKVGADGIRGDVAMVNCAEALAALNGRDEVMRKDVEEAAVLCLPHRRNYDQPPPPPQQPPEQPPEQEPPDDRKDDQQPPQQDDDDKSQRPKEEPPEQSDKDDEQPPRPPQQEMPDVDEMMFEIGRQFRVIDYLDSRERVPSRTKTRKGRRAMATSADGTGRYARAKVPQGKVTDVAFDATIRAAAPYQRARRSESNGLGIIIEEQDLREKVRERRSGATIMFLVDASGSLGVRRRMAAVKGAVLSMLRDSYVRRDRVGMMAFRRSGAEVILPPTRSVEYSYRKLEELPTGGRTPLPEALVFADEYMTAYARTHVGERCYVVVVTDGRANVPLKEGDDANKEVLDEAGKIRIPNVKWIVVDASSGFPHFDNAERLAEGLEARYFRLEDLDADRLADGVRAAMDARRQSEKEMTQTICVILASPSRNGSTSSLAMEAANAAEGADVHVHFLNKMDFRDCQGCHACKKGRPCPLKDDLTPVLDDVRDCDALIIATPVYFGRATGLYDMYEDRTFRLYSEQPEPPRRRALVVVSAGAPIKYAQPTAERIQRILTRRNFETSVLLHSLKDDGPGKDSERLIAEAREIGRKLLEKPDEEK